MTTLTLETEPIAIKVALTEDDLIVDLSDGRRISVPLAWYPRLAYATPAERKNFELLGDGYAIEFPDIDEHIGMDGVAGWPSEWGKPGVARKVAWQS